VLGLLAATMPGGEVRAISRTEVMINARAYAFHPWTCTTANLTASCDASYQSAYVPGDYLGLPYDWGGYMSLFSFDQQIAQGAGAGSAPSDGILSCTAGLDCSGYVSRCWGVGHYTTSSLPDISTVIQQSEILPGDILNQAGYHVVLFSHLLGSGEPVFYEAVGYNVHFSPNAGWSWVQGYLPRRYHDITGTAAGSPAGTPHQPIVIGSLPYTDSRDTSGSPSDVLDGCGAAPGTDESGPEYVYEVTLTQPGQLTVSVSDDVGVDVDAHLYTSMNTGDCVARHDSSFTEPVDCGTYYIVADTYDGAAQAGPYDLTVDFTPSGGGCGAGPPGYSFEGELGDRCGNPNQPDLPFCNENLGAAVCLYNSQTSWCTKPCASAPDCTDAFPGGCCADIGSGEYYCFPAAQCAAPDPDAGVPDAGPTDGGIPARDGGVGPGQEGGVGPGEDSGTGAPDPREGGCGCRSPRHEGAPLAPVLVLLGGLVLLGRRRRCRRRERCLGDRAPGRAPGREFDRGPSRKPDRELDQGPGLKPGPPKEPR
jgi:hypothetical protein